MREGWNVAEVLYRVVFMRLFSAAGRKPWGELILAGCHLRDPQLLFCIWLGLEGWCKWRTGVGVRHTPKDKVHLTFRGR